MFLLSFVLGSARGSGWLKMEVDFSLGCFLQFGCTQFGKAQHKWGIAALGTSLRNTPRHITPY
jgi:hypothetical protein